MQIIITAREALNRGIWDDVCELKGINPWALNEGLMSSKDEITLTQEEAKKLGLV
jgi:hypothetical protein